MATNDVSWRSNPEEARLSHLNFRLLFTSLLILGFFASSYTGLRRWQFESRNKRVELAVDMDELKSLSTGTGVLLPDLLQEFQKAGATSVAISEDTLTSLRSEGRLTLLSQDAVASLFPDLHVDDTTYLPNNHFVITSSPDIANRIIGLLGAKVACRPHLYGQRTLHGGSPIRIIGLDGNRELLEEVGLGMDAGTVRLARESGLGVIGRLYNYPSLNATAIESMLKNLQDNGVTNAIFAADEVAGYRDLLDRTADSLNKCGIHFGSVEFAKQRGDAQLSDKLHSRVVRVHSINALEMNTLMPADAVERFARAVRERNIRLCYVRLFPQMKEHALLDNMRYIQSLAKSMREGGFTLGSARPFDSFHTPVVLLIVCGVGVLAAGLLLLDELITLPAGWAWGLFLCGTLMIAGGLAVATTLLMKVAALAAGCIYPSLGYCVSGMDTMLRAERQGKKPGAVFLRSLGCLLKASAVTLVGAAMVVGLLGDLRFMVKTDQFIGIKLSQLAPMMIVMFVLVSGLLTTRGKPLKDRLADCREQIRIFMDQPILIRFAVFGFIGLVFMAVWMARTGNEPGVGVSELEMRFRAVLERILIARPRTKEFVVGHPAFLLAGLIAWRGHRGWAIPLVLLGMVGQTSMLNTFCHIHTPICASALRTFNGLWLGILIGMVLWVLVPRILPGDCGSVEHDS